MAKLYRSRKTVFTSNDIALIWREKNKDSLYAKTAYYVNSGALIRLTRGVFAKSPDYDPKELAASIYIPSYISFETVLREAGIIFQHYRTIFVATKWPKTVSIGKHSFTYRKLKDQILFNPAGIANQDNYSIASPERAFLDMIYLFPNYYFDNLRSLDWEKCAELAKIYGNRELLKRLEKYKKNYVK